MKFHVVWLMVLGLIGQANAQGTVQAHGENMLATVSPPSVDQWLRHLHEAARQSAYAGTFVVTAGSYMSSARVWHVCDGMQQMERIEALTGPPRATYRRNDQVVTYLPESRVAIVEKRASLGLFPNLFSRADSSIAQFYRLKINGRDRIAGLVADVAQLVPRDQWRFGYRIWTEQATGLVVKLQTLDPTQAVLEQAAFSDLQLAQPISWAKLSAMMDNTEGYIVKNPELISTTADQEGWQLSVNVPGFKSVSCHKRKENGTEASNGPLQWVFSDGLASVSLFVEVFNAARHSKQHPQERFSMGATHMQTRQIGNWWLTVVGEVPLETLQRFAQGLERKK